MQNALQRLNALPAAEAQAELLACCGASLWARELVARRPFANSADLFAAADETWRSLDRDGWLEAFASHPQIGEKRGEKQIESEAGQKLSSRWSAEEQSGTQRHAAEVMAKLEEGNRAYRRRFGYIFIVCATGKTASEMLAILEQRLQNDPSAELMIAAEEQRRIMHLRLEKLLAIETTSKACCKRLAKGTLENN
jgi:2-oxo-4-hydroxy-4-carboxy-5-ureidoimidazoline decarboxylase